MIFHSSGGLAVKLASVTLIPFLSIFTLRSMHHGQVEAAVGLHGPDRYEGLPEICLMSMDFGHCRARVQRYYFDIRRMKCTMFFWGGCAGNDNNFKTIEECNDFCGTHYENLVRNEVVLPAKKERTESRGSSTKYNTINSRDSGAPKSVPKNALKPNVTFKDTGYKSSAFKASAKIFNVNPAPKISNSHNSKNNPSDVIDDEEYDD